MYTFTEDCRLGIEEIDKEHEELFRLINEAQELLDQKMASEKIVANIVDHLGRYAREHFAHEEAYMESIKDPELPRQKKEHQEFAAKIESIELSGAGEAGTSWQILCSTWQNGCITISWEVTS